MNIIPPAGYVMQTRRSGNVVQTQFVHWRDYDALDAVRRGINARAGHALKEIREAVMAMKGEAE